MSLDIYVYAREKRDSREYILTVSSDNGYAEDYSSYRGLQDLAKWIALQREIGKDYRGKISVKNYDPFLRLDKTKHGSPLTGNEKRNFRKGVSKKILINWIDKKQD